MAGSLVPLEFLEAISIEFLFNFESLKIGEGIVWYDKSPAMTFIYKFKLIRKSTLTYEHLLSTRTQIRWKVPYRIRHTLNRTTAHELDCEFIDYRVQIRVRRLPVTERLKCNSSQRESKRSVLFELSALLHKNRLAQLKGWEGNSTHEISKGYIVHTQHVWLNIVEEGGWQLFNIDGQSLVSDMRCCFYSKNNITILILKRRTRRILNVSRIKNSPTLFFPTNSS